MVQLQALNRMIAAKDISLISKNGLDASYFAPYEAEAQFIIDHYNKYKAVPDAETVIAQFPDFSFFTVAESDSYLLSALKEEKTYADVVPIIQKAAELLKTDANDAVDYLKASLRDKGINAVSAIDIVHGAESRFDSYAQKKNGDFKDFFITTGFEELDSCIHGFKRGEEFVVLFARTNQGKSWILTKMLTHAWQIGNNVGLISPEMSAESVGYRFDTLYKNFDNQALNFGEEADGYAEYIEKLKDAKNNFLVATPTEFDNQITVSKLRAFIEKNNLQILGIDGMSYLKDERAGKFDKREAELTHISEDLVNMSRELNTPIIGVVQANRDGVKLNGGDIQLENIRDADGISYSATKVLSIRQKFDDETIELSVKKNRNGRVGGKLIYHWIPEVGEFKYIPSTDSDSSFDKTAIAEAKTSFASKKGCVF
jgi:replicative DNA helicase